MRKAVLTDEIELLRNAHNHYKNYLKNSTTNQKLMDMGFLTEFQNALSSLESLSKEASEQQDQYNACIKKIDLHTLALSRTILSSHEKKDEKKHLKTYTNKLSIIRNKINSIKLNISNNQYVASYQKIQYFYAPVIDRQNNLIRYVNMAAFGLKILTSLAYLTTSLADYNDFTVSLLELVTATVGLAGTVLLSKPNDNIISKCIQTTMPFTAVVLHTSGIQFAVKTFQVIANIPWSQLEPFLDLVSIVTEFGKAVHCLQ